MMPSRFGILSFLAFSANISVRRNFQKIMKIFKLARKLQPLNVALPASSPAAFGSAKPVILRPEPELKAERLSTAVLSLHLNLVLFYYSSSASSASACASFATSWPDFTLSPSLTQTFSTVPSIVAITLVSIFIASITATG